MDKLPAKVSKPKHAYKVHIWGGISYQGRTDLCLFTGVMDYVTYQRILYKNFLPFAQQKLPQGFYLYQDNDSKHKSRSTKSWMKENGMADKVMPSPVSSPDLNPIENAWKFSKEQGRTFWDKHFLGETQ